MTYTLAVVRYPPWATRKLLVTCLAWVAVLTLVLVVPERVLEEPWLLVLGLLWLLVAAALGR